MNSTWRWLCRPCVLYRAKHLIGAPFTSPASRSLTSLTHKRPGGSICGRVPACQTLFSLRWHIIDSRRARKKMKLNCSIFHPPLWRGTAVNDLVPRRAPAVFVVSDTLSEALPRRSSHQYSLPVEPSSGQKTR